MNVEQYIAQELNVTGVDLMGDEIPIDSNCGHSCKLVIDAAKELIEFDGDWYDCDARYAYIGHIISAFGPRSQELDDFLDNDSQVFIDQVQHICQVYIFG